METPRPALRSIRLLDQVRERIRYCHYSLRTEQAYVFWVRRFIRFHRLQHPRQMGAAEVEAFLTYLATDRNVAPSPTSKRSLPYSACIGRSLTSICLGCRELDARKAQFGFQSSCREKRLPDYLPR